MSRTRYRIFEEEYPYFLTMTVVAWLPIFAHSPFVDILFDSWRFLQTERGVRIFGYAVRSQAEPGNEGTRAAWERGQPGQDEETSA